MGVASFAGTDAQVRQQRALANHILNISQRGIGHPTAKPIPRTKVEPLCVSREVWAENGAMLIPRMKVEPLTVAQESWVRRGDVDSQNEG